MKLHRATFHPADLVAIPRPEKPVVLVSGGPIMDLVSVEGEYGICEWRNGRKVARAKFKLICLYECRDMGGYVR